MVGGDQVADFFEGYIWRVLLYSGTLTSTNATELAAWANANWVVGSTASSSRLFNVNWQQPTTTAGIDGYKVYYSTTYGGTDNSVVLSGVGSTSTSFTVPSAGTWYVTVRTTSSGNEGDDVNITSRAVQ
jgi:hypothetical protein